MLHKTSQPEACVIIAGMFAASIVGAPLVGYGLLGATATFALQSATYLCIIAPRTKGYEVENTEEKFEVI